MFCHEHGTVDYCPECDESAKDVTIAKLQAVVDSLSDALRKAGNLADIERWYERYPLVYGSMTDAIKEVVK